MKIRLLRLPTLASVALLLMPHAAFSQVRSMFDGLAATSERRTS
jgi:hypothetical protein